MGLYKIATLAQGVAGLALVTSLGTDATDPHPAPFFEYTEIVGRDLNQADIEAGLPRCTWKWGELDATAFDALCDYSGAAGNNVVYITTRKNVYASSAYTFANYQATMSRPRGETVPNERYADVEIDFSGLVAQ